MFPNLVSAFSNWTSPTQMRVVSKVAVDLELFEDTLAIVELEMMLSPMPPQKVNRKPEGERAWKWWEGISTTELQNDTVVQDPAGVQYRLQSRQDWSQSGFFNYEMTEQPNGS